MRKFALLVSVLLFSFQLFSNEPTSTVMVKLKPQKDKNYLATKDPEMNTLASKHGLLAFKQSWPGAKIPDLLLCYDLKFKRSMSKQSRERLIHDLPTTGKFEDEVFEYPLASILSVNPVTVNDSAYCVPNGNNRWPLDMIQASYAWAITTGDPGTYIGIVDSELNENYVDLQGKFSYILGNSAEHSAFHGTQVAAVAAANTNNGVHLASRL